MSQHACPSEELTVSAEPNPLALDSVLDKLARQRSVGVHRQAVSATSTSLPHNQSIRSASAGTRRMSKKYTNARMWKCEMYCIRVYMAGSGERIVERHGINDIANVALVVTIASQALLIAPSRLRILYNGEVLDTTSGSSLYQVGRFNRNLTFEVVVIPPARCRVCHYMKTINRPTTHCSLLKGVGYDYWYVPGGMADRDDATLQTLDSSEADEFENSYGWDFNADLGLMQSECYCWAIAEEFGWKKLRSWQRLTKGLQKGERARKGGFGARTAPLEPTAGGRRASSSSGAVLASPAGWANAEMEFVEENRSLRHDGE